MTQDNVDLVRRSFQALAHGDFEAAFADHDPNTEWRTASDEPDSQTYRGIEGLWRLVATLAEPWENRFDGSVQLNELQAHGPWVIVPWRGRLHGRGSGLELEVFETCAVLVRAGKIARVEEYRTTEEAVQAVRARGAAAG